MSVTFTAEIDPTAVRSFRLSCEDGTDIGLYSGYSNAYSEAAAHGLVCLHSLCQQYGADIDEITDVPSMNVTNANAYPILAALGYTVDLEEPELIGDADASDMLARIDIALALAPVDPGTDTLEYQDGDTDRPAAIVTEYGRPAGYTQTKLRELRTIAVYCISGSRKVVWG